jgi:hypothetical protein
MHAALAKAGLEVPEAGAAVMKGDGRENSERSRPKVRI